MKPSPFLTATNFLCAALFGVFAWFQHNDIDPEIYHNPSELDAVLWLAFYLLIAILFLIAAFRPVPRWILILAAVACFVEMIRSGPGLYENLFGERDFTMTQIQMTAEDPRVELSREFFGAVIALAAVGFLYFQRRRLVGKQGADFAETSSDK